MAKHLSSVLDYIRHLAAPGARARDETDLHLLDRFVRAREQDAFEALVRRHGPMVFGVCRRVVGNSHDAEDALQATFLILARKAGSLRRPERLANWLYGVARRTAFKASAMSARRRPFSVTGASPVCDPVETATKRDDHRVLEEELGRLPDRYRAPLVLCYLEGRTTQEAARTLGCPQNTVLTRLARGRQRLHGRLVRRGVTFGAALLTAENMSAAVPLVLIDATVRVALLATPGGVAAGAISAEVAALTHGVMQAMFWNKCVILVSVVMAVGGISVGAGWVHQAGQSNQRLQETKVSSVPQDPVPKEHELPLDPEKAAKGVLSMPPGVPRFDDKKVEKLLERVPRSENVKTLLAARHTAAAVEATARYAEFMAGRGTQEFLLAAAERLLRAELAMSKSQEDHVAAHENYLKLLTDIHNVNLERFKAARIPIQVLTQAEVYLLDAQLALADVKGER